MPLSGAGPVYAGFTASRAQRVMVEACAVAGLDSEGARLIRLGENALFRLERQPVIVRIARSEEYLESARREVAVSTWLEGEGFPAARVLADAKQAVIVSSHPVTFWHLIREGGRKATYRELGSVLRELHALSVPEALSLPKFEPMGRSALRIERAAEISEPDREFLRERHRQLERDVEGLSFPSPVGPVHGDAHIQNLMVDESGRVVLIDFEVFCRDHPEWDLMVTATEHDSLGWQTPDQYAEFVGAYGRDLRDWSGFPTLRAIQEFKMTTWLMQNVGESGEVAREYERRIASLRDDHAPRDWHPG